MKKTKPHLYVVAAAIFNNNSVYCFKKGEHKFDYLSNRYEFPGGKIKDGESQRTALFREIREELKVKIDVGEKIIEFDYEYPDFSLSMTGFKCEVKEANFCLTEHTEVLLIHEKELKQLEWLPADIPIVNKIFELADE